MSGDFEARRAREGFDRLGHMLQTQDCFDDKDMTLWEETRNRLDAVDPDLLILRHYVKQRQECIARLDSEYNLSEFVPDMMHKFASKDAKLQMLLNQKEREHEERLRSPGYDKKTH